jgi:MFS family permease
MQIVAVGWQVYALTRQPLDLGLIGLAEFLPAPLLVLITGHIADRYDRSRILRYGYSAQAVFAGLLLWVTQAGRVDVWIIFGIVFLVGTARAFHGATARAMVANLVPAEALANAIAWRSTGLQSALVGGPALGGVLYAAGPEAVYAISMTLQTAAALLTLGMQQQPIAQSRPERPSWASLTAGLRFIRGTPILLGAISLDLFAVLFGGATALLPVYARDILLMGPTGLGALRSAPAAGAIAMAIFLTHHPPQRRVGRTLFLAVALFGAATVVFAFSVNFYLSLVMLAVAGAADMVSMYIRSILVPLATPDQMRGRVTAAEMVFIGASNELGAFESGVLAALIGAIPSVAFGGIATLVIAAAWIRLFPSLYRIDRLTDP